MSFCSNMVKMAKTNKTAYTHSYVHEQDRLRGMYGDDKAGAAVGCR